MQGVLAAGRKGRWPDTLLEHAINKGLPGTFIYIRERLHKLVDQGFGPPHVATCCR